MNALQENCLPNKWDPNKSSIDFLGVKFQYQTDISSVEPEKNYFWGNVSIDKLWLLKAMSSMVKLSS